MRDARVCYDHLAGARAVAVLDALIERGAVVEVAGVEGDADLVLTDEGAVLFERFGIDLPTLQRARRPVCQACLDWSERRFHLGGGLDAAVLTALYDRGWAKREAGTRVVRFTNHGLAQFRETFGMADVQ